MMPGKVWKKKPNTNIDLYEQHPNKVNDLFETIEFRPTIDAGVQKSNEPIN